MSVYFETLQEQADQLEDVEAQRRFFAEQIGQVPQHYPDGYDLAVEIEDLANRDQLNLFFPVILSSADGSLQGFTDRLGVSDPDELRTAKFVTRNALEVSIQPVTRQEDLSDLDYMVLNHLQRRPLKLPGVRVHFYKSIIV